MKCPWKDHIHIKKDGMGHIYRDVEWEECYKEQCPFYAKEQCPFYAKDKRRKKDEMCLRFVSDL